MGWRACVWWGGVRLESAGLESGADAAALLARLLASLPGATDGVVEVRFPGVGWVRADEADAVAWLYGTGGGGLW